MVAEAPNLERSTKVINKGRNCPPPASVEASQKEDEGVRPLAVCS